MTPTLHLTGDPAADTLLSEDPLALLAGMLLDQQVPMERAFAGPVEIARRLGRTGLDAREIAEYDPEGFAGLLARKPAVHRYPSSMAGRLQELCRYLVENYDGDAAAVWRDAGTGRELLRRLQELPGYGRQKSQIFLALLGKQLDVRPEGWRAAAGEYGEEGSLKSVADIRDAESLAGVRAFKQRRKAEAKAARAGHG
ncbi:HhH-GPD-type base excision DNA repair protein [Marinitenerispora sediminis]|uniref:Fe-S cluster assembly protein HesB n=1 Tax=Marinitenerispora sediminis TaxID=1931232 RepID=A0A368TAR4_9ACTN|nr:HhH-GPD-type base excision DNA repair protein [Marinitenerispora sediminis]RCV56977.1 Fe-S cluster assembly protein HesB [Marinitenerispora sediminis]RCV60183.1 Fe-S cluster assembly protein HesB [Marinitenerispora sediminis]RCV62112.1 Fe-S cluster assembly protein HesB [Marinitenerispora sediminis]